MGVWFTSDPHIGHRKIAEIRMEAWQRRHGGLVFDAQYRTPEEIAARQIAWHDKLLADNWDAVIRPDDQVWILGDISAGGTEAQRSALRWFDKRPGRKFLILGNHDGPHPHNRDAHKWFGEYAEHFELVSTAARRKVLTHNVFLSHFPYEGDHTSEERYGQWRLRDEGGPLLHGHTHGEEPLGYHARQYHVGLDAHDFKPVPLSTIEGWVNTIAQLQEISQ